MTDCVQYKKDTNPCSPTYGEYRIFDAPCPPIFVEESNSPIGNDFILYVENNVNSLFTLEIVNQSNQKIIVTISIEPQVNEIYLKEGVYRLCFYTKNNGSNFAMSRVGDNQKIYANSCRDNVNVNQNFNYKIDYL